MGKVKIGMFEEVLEQGGSIVGQAAKQIAKTPSDLAKAAASQVAPGAGQGTGDATDIARDKDTQDFVKDLYGSSQKSPQNQVTNQPAAQSQNPLNNLSQKSPEDQKKLLDLQKKLHDEVYYQPLVNPPKPQEERPAEKIEREKEEEKMEQLQDDQKKQKDDESVAAVRAQQRVEKYPGASG